MKAIVKGNSPRDIFVISDSAFGRDVMPLFLPDGTWEGELRLALRINRLGKHIPQKFATRYIDAISLVLIIRPAGERQAPQWLGIMDSAITTGAWLPWDNDDAATAQVEHSHGVCQLQYSDICSSAAKSIAEISELATIKTGDVIIPPLPPISAPLAPETRIDASINGAPCLKLKIK